MAKDVRLSLRGVFEAVELPQMEEPEAPKRCGRPPFPPKAMVSSLLFIPLGVASERDVRVTSGNVHENREFKPLVKAAEKLGLKASRVCGDAILDTKDTRRFIKALGARAFIDHNPRRVRRKRPASKNLQTPQGLGGEGILQSQRAPQPKKY